MTGLWQVYAFRYAFRPIGSGAEVFVGGDPKLDVGGMDYFFWALRSGDRVIVVDTGASAAKMPAKGRTPLIDPVAALAGVGIDAAQVEQVFLTHAHWDHVGNLNLFPNAHFWMQRREMASITGPDMTYPRIRGSYQMDEAQRLVELVYEDRLTFLDGDGTFAPGVDYILTAGHSAGQTALFVETTNGRLLLASDAVHYYVEFRDELPFAAFNDMKAMLASLRRVKALVGGDMDRMIPGHDPLVSTRYPAETTLADGTAAAIRLDLPPTKPLDL